LLVTRGHALETLARSDCFVLDKTGTVTEGRPVLRDVKLLRGTREAALAMAKALESVSEHPFGGAIRSAAGDSLVAEGARNFPGRGVEGVVGGRRVRIGNADFVAQLCKGTIRGTFGGVWLGDEGGPIAAFSFSDEIRADAAAVVQQLRAHGERIVLLSGDSEMAVREVAEKLGIEEWKAAMSPQDKLQYVKLLQERGATVAMVGDGVNDAPVLAQAQVSIAMPSGAALAQGTADMMLLSGRLLDLAGGLRHARRTLRIIRQNLGWALAYNTVAIPLAVAGFVTPWLAGIGMAGSSMLVVVNALRLSAQKRKGGLEKQNADWSDADSEAPSPPAPRIKSGAGSLPRRGEGRNRAE
jgi:Cu2+-exporting ATPase